MSRSHTDYMIIDIETFGLGQHAPIIAVAALRSDDRIITAKLDLDMQFKHGAQPTHACCEWWMRQPACEWLDCYGLTSPEMLLWLINDMYQKDIDVWTRGDFDIPTLGNLFCRFGLTPDRDWHPWHYSKLHNIRTAQMITGANDDALHMHDPLQDCTDDQAIIEKYYSLLP